MKMICEDCKKDTNVPGGDYYMVTNTLWAEYGAGRGFLCLDCLQTRVGRPLVREDFPQWIPLNVFTGKECIDRHLAKNYQS